MKKILTLSLLLLCMYAEGANMDSLLPKAKHAIGIKYIDNQFRFYTLRPGDKIVIIPAYVGLYYYNTKNITKTFSLNPGIGITYARHNMRSLWYSENYTFTSLGLEALLNARKKIGKRIHVDANFYINPKVTKEVVSGFSRNPQITKDYSFSTPVTATFGAGILLGRWDIMLEAGTRYDMRFDRHISDLHLPFVCRIGMAYRFNCSSL